MKIYNHHYNINLKTYARANRKVQTFAETLLWQKLRNRQLLGLRFLRQRSIGNYIVDFVQTDYNLIIEIDGASHDENKFIYDRRRQSELESFGYTVFRFTEFETKRNIENVLSTIYQYLVRKITPPTPSQEGKLKILV